MISIRRRLLLLLLPALAILVLLGGLVDYWIADATTRSAYDHALANTALAFASSVRVEEQHLRFMPPPPPPAGAAATLYAITGPNREFIAGTPQLASAPLGAEHNAGAAEFHNLEYGGRTWRVASILLPTAVGPVRIAAAETLAGRARTQHLMLLGKLLVDFAELDLTLLLVWIGVSYGLRPLAGLATELERHSPRDLRRLDETEVPAELRPVIAAFNRVLELLSSAASAQRRFVSDAAHQMRTPVAGLAAQIELLLREPNAAGPQQFETLHRGIQQLARAANQLLALARAEPVAVEQKEHQSVDLKLLVEQLIERHLERADRARIDLGAEALPARVLGDAFLIEDLLENLIDNALKYTPSGGAVTVGCGVEAGGAPYLEVEDDGPGIPEAERQRVRERFYRRPGSPGIGCGLGLAIVDEIARLHGANLTIGTGANERGARMRVRFRSAE
jgi:two-component system, OmpR family, sensor histidine kinase TctE